jgi:hypothetical protein
MSVAFGGGGPVRQTPFKEHHWDRLLNEIGDGAVVPIVGPELLEIEADGVRAPLYDHLAGRLARRLLDVPAGAAEEQLTFQQVADLHVQNRGDLEDVYAGLQELVTKTQWPTPEPLKLIAAIPHFDLYISTTFDRLLEQALTETRPHHPAVPLAYSKRCEFDDIAAVRPAPGVATVYQLFGRARTLRDFVVTDDDLLDFICRLQSTDHRPRNLFQRLRNSNLLLLGCRFPDWLARFFLYAAKGDGLFHEGLRGVVADGRLTNETDLVLFLQRRHTSVFMQGGAVDFVKELHRLWHEAYGNVEPEADKDLPIEGLDPCEDDAFFISYASEDRPKALALVEALAQRGLPVWYDRMKLDSGDRYREKIMRNIERSAFFVPLISRHCATPERRFFRLEWDKAKDELKRASFDPQAMPFVLPLVVDDTPFDPPFLGGLFRDLHWCRFETNAPPDSFLGRCEQLLREHRRRKRGLV